MPNMTWNKRYMLRRLLRTENLALTLLLIEKGLTLSEIARVLGVNKARVYYYFKRLQELGFIEVEKSPVDKREKQAVLTKKGAEYAEEVFKPLVKRYLDSDYCLKPEAPEALKQLLSDNIGFERSWSGKLCVKSQLRFAFEVA